jgi:hypothetical protein
MDTVMRGRRAIPGLEAHHVVPKEVMELLGIPEVQWRDVPGLLVDQWKHRRNNTPGDLSFHHILAEELRGVDVSVANLEEVILRLRAAYTRFGMDDAGIVAETWLRARFAP